jgi:hypothetical protein
MFKSIKKSFKYLMILIGTLILVPTFFSLIFRIPDVQTFMVRRIAGHFSEKIKSTITVGRVDYSFFNRIVINDLLIKDQNLDTMVYSQKISIGITGINPGNKKVKLGHVDLTEPFVALITDTSGMMNLKWYLNMLGTSKNTGGKSSGSVSISQITVKGGRFKLVDKNATAGKMMIDFNNLRIDSINGNIEDLKILNDSVVFKIIDLGFSGSNGFLTRSMNSRVVLAHNDIIFRDMFLYLDSSIINADNITVSADSSDSYKSFADEVRLKIDLQKSLISSADLRYFVPSLHGLNESVELSGKISGTLSEMKGRKIRVSFRDYSSIDCDFDLSGLPKIEDTFIHLGVTSFKTNPKDLEKIKLSGGTSIKLPEFAAKLGNISFNGSFTGFTTDFVTYGKIRTDLGNISTDISLRPESGNAFRVKGLVKGSNLDLGQLTNNSNMLGKLTMETNVDGVATSSKKISGNLTGKIDSIEVNKYLYRNVTLNGIFTEKTWDGTIKISDKNIKMDMLGMLDFRNELPEFDFTLNLGESNLYKLNFDKADTASRLAMLATANFRGNNIDNIFGEIKLLNSTLNRHNDKLELYDFSLKAYNENNKPAISLKTDFLDADLTGYYKFGELGNIVKSALASIMPSKFKPPVTGKKLVKNDFTFALNFKNTDKLNKFFKTGIILSDKSYLSGRFCQDSLIKIDANAKIFNYRNIVFNNLTINSVYADSVLNTDLKASSLSILGQPELKDFKAGFRTKPDNFIFSFDWDNKEKTPNKGAFIARGSVVREEDGSKNTILKISVAPSEIATNKNIWEIRQSAIRIDSNSTHIDKFIVASKNNSYMIDGTISKNSGDTLSLEFRGIDLSPLSQMGKNESKGNDSEIPFNPKGIINGNVLISSTLKDPMIESNIRVNGFSLLGADYGDVSAVSLWNSSRKVAEINVNNNLNGKKNIEIKGFYDPAVKHFNLTGIASNLPVEALNPLLNFFASEITGTASGKVNLSGTPGALVMKGALMAENTSMKINYLQTKYKISDTIRFDKEGIKFKNIKVTDEKNNSALLSGAVYHKYFKDYSVDLIVNMDKNPCLVLNTQQKDNDLFYGTAYATGVTTIKSGPNSLSFDISAKTAKGTRCFIPLNSGLSVTEHSFVTFINRDTARKETAKNSMVATGHTSATGLEMTFDLDVTPDAEVRLLFDPKVGDVIRGRGEGKLNISLDKKGEFKIYGDYVIDEGDYLFTLKNILNKRFDVDNGGKITFNGDVDNAEIELTAKYKNIKTSLYPILFPILQDDKYKERIAVEPELNLSGKLFSPVVGLDIYLPNSDEETRTYLKNAITTEEERSRQFVYLLVMNSFYSDPSSRSGITNTATGGSAMAVTTTEMLSNQLSNWVSQIIKDFDVGFLYTPGTKNINSQELQVALSTQLLNDKVTVNGNFGVGGTQTADQTPLIGDFDIEYKITEKIRFKVFNRYNSPYTGRNSQYTQGLGVFYKQDFNRFSDLLKKKNNSEMKKEDEVSVTK